MKLGMNPSIQRTWLNKNLKYDTGFFKTVCYSTSVTSDFNVYVKDDWLNGGFIFPALKNVFHLEKNNKLDWRPFKPGIDAIWLFRNHDGSAQALLKFQPGAAVPPHWHLGYEMVLCVEGSFNDERGSYNKGDLNVNPTGSHHHNVHSEKGCILLISWTKNVEFLKFTNPGH